MIEYCIYVWFFTVMLNFKLNIIRLNYFSKGFSALNASKIGLKIHKIIIII